MRGLEGRRLPTVVGSVLVVGAVVAGVMLVDSARTPAAAFAQVGHWVFNRSENAVVHVDSGIRRVDARVAVPATGDDLAFAVQGATRGFLVGRKNITVFGKSTLTVETTLPTDQTELPVPVETVGGPYLVYRSTGTVVRLGVPPVTMPLGGPLSRPVALDDGTLWLHRTDTGELCHVGSGMTAPECEVATAQGATGDLAVVQNAAGFVDTGADVTAVIEPSAILDPVPLGADVPEAGLIGDRDTQDRLPVVAPGVNRLVMADTGGVLVGRGGGAPVVVELGPGCFSSPVVADGVIAVIEQDSRKLLTYGVDGRSLGSADLPPGQGDAQIVRGGDGRLYVDDADGARTHVIGADGSVTAVRTGAATNAVVAAAPELASIVSPPSMHPTTSDRSGPGDPTALQDPDSPPTYNEPGTGPGQGGDGGARDPDTPPQRPVLPAAPTGVKVVANGVGQVTVSWAAAERAQRYGVLADGRVAAETSGLTFTIPSLVFGRSYQLTVAGLNEVGQGPQSAAVAFIGPTLPAAAPLNVNASRHNNGPTTMVTLSWGAPDLKGGQLVGYRVTNSGGGGQPGYTKTESKLWHDDGRTYCGSNITLRFEVRAVTRATGSTAEIMGSPATASVQPGATCALQINLQAAEATGPTTATVTVRCRPANGATDAGSGPVTVSAGDPSTSVACQADGVRNIAQLTGLQPGQTYKVSATFRGTGGGPLRARR